MSAQIKITLPDGAVRDYATGTTGAEVAADISTSLGKAALACRIDGVLSDLSCPIDRGFGLIVHGAELEYFLGRVGPGRLDLGQETLGQALGLHEQVGAHHDRASLARHLPDQLDVLFGFLYQCFLLKATDSENVPRFSKPC